MGLAPMGLSMGERCTKVNVISFETSIVIAVPVPGMHLLSIGGHFSFSTCH